MILSLVQRYRYLVVLDSSQHLIESSSLETNKIGQQSIHIHTPGLTQFNPFDILLRYGHYSKTCLVSFFEHGR